MINIITNVVYADMPAAVKAYTVENADDSYTIVLNSHLNREQHLISYRHELAHIYNRDFDRACKDVDAVEVFAHGL